LLLCVPAALVIACFVAAARLRLRESQDEMPRWIRRGAVTGIVAIALQETVDFSLQMPGNAFLFALLAAIVLHRDVTSEFDASQARTAARVSR
jgi:hypothetical protein